ncbi:hypothetical protein BDF19DRAFT_127551 [Syncephalis fuscata]|nr:hypothetical protein BDF19DRAFT_127551 [Syncephalis fuscata]
MSNHLLVFDTCADSTQTLIDLIQDLAKHFPSDNETEDILENILEGVQVDDSQLSEDIEGLLADLEEDTFAAKKRSTLNHETRPSQEWHITPSKVSGSEDEEEQIYSLNEEELLVVEDHFAATPNTSTSSTSTKNTQCRLLPEQDLDYMYQISM